MEYKNGKEFSWHDFMSATLKDGRTVKIIKIEAEEGTFYHIIFIEYLGRGYMEEVHLIQDLSSFEKEFEFDKLNWRV